MAESPYITGAEFADLVRTSPETVRYWKWKSKGPVGFKLGRKVLYDRRECEAWIAAQRAAQTAPPTAV